MGKFSLILIMALSSHLFADLTISALTYDQKSDELLVTAQFPGKCMEHTLTLTKTKNKGKKNYFLLEVTNSAHDPCNALNQQSARFSLQDVIDRPAEILVSTNADGSKPHFLSVPPHQNATIMKVRNLDNGSLSFTLRFNGPADADRFYVAMDCQTTNDATCEGVVRDKRAQAYAHERLQTKDIVLAPKNLPRPQMLVFTYGDQRRAVRILVP